MAELGVIRGRVWRFGDNVSSTDIFPHEMFRTSHRTLKEIAFAAIRPDWRANAKAGDCIVGGKNFGFGSSRTSANDVMKEFELGCVVADSFARIFYRNSIAVNFPAFACPGVSKIFNEGEELELDMESGLVKNLTTGQKIEGRPYPPQLLEILRAGGMMRLIVAKSREKSRLVLETRKRGGKLNRRR